MKWAIIILFLVSSVASADEVTTISELVRLPFYCKGVRQVRRISNDPVPLEAYVRKYGHAYNHLHHYCWALNAENNAIIENRQTKLTYAIKDIDYVLRNNHDPNFVFLPEIYVSKARILFKLGQESDAVKWLKMAIKLRPNYAPAYARLSDYYVDKGDAAEAMRILKEGVAKSGRSEMLKRKITELKK